VVYRDLCSGRQRNSFRNTSFPNILTGTAWSAAVTVPSPVPNTGFKFDGWTPAFPITVTASATYTANFVVDKAVPRKVADLIVYGKKTTTDVGDLIISYNEGSFYIEYSPEAPWEIIKTSVYIGTSAPANSSPGRFPYQAGDIEFDSGSADSVYIAAYAEVRKQTGIDKKGKPVYVYEGAWAQTGTDYKIDKGAKFSTYFEYTLK
jgi:hypothetical protein